MSWLRRWLGALAVGLLIAGGSGCKQTNVRSKAPTTKVAEPARARFNAGVELMDKGAENYDKAIREFNAAIKLAPDLWEAHLNIGIIELRRARLGAAARAFERSTKIYASPEASEALGEVYLRQGRAKKAVALYQQALSQNSADLRLRNRLAVALRRSGDHEQAEAELRAILGQDAGDADAYGTLAAIKMDADELDLAELVLAKGLERTPNDPGLLTNMGLVALRRGNDQLAFTYFEKASAADPRFLTGRLNKAAVYLGAGDHTRAQAELEFILGVEPGNTEALLGLGVAQRLAGDHKAAKTSWDRVLRIDPDNADAHFNLAVLELDFNEKPDAAKKHLERYMQLAPKDDPRVAQAKERLELIKVLNKG